jgi:sugar phosphate isomerase/epimerase
VAGTKIGAQLYTLRDFAKTPKDIATTLRKVREIGYEAVQLSGLGPIEARELKKILDGEGLIAGSTHTELGRLRNDLGAVIEEHHLWECRHIAIGGLPIEMHNPQGYAAYAREGSEIAKKLAAEGLTLSYHNHHRELNKVAGRCALDIFLEEGDPELFLFEIDTYWVQMGGASPADWIRKVKGRVPLIHCKDLTVLDWKTEMAEVGEGNLDWDGILKAAEEAGVEWYLVEQDTCQRDPFESLAISLKNLKGMGIQ